MAPLEKLNNEQMRILLDFAARCSHLCFGRPRAGPDAEIIAYKEWKELAREMNYAGNLPWKSGKEWKMYWTELKNRTKGKVAHARRKSKFSGTPVKLRLNCFEDHIIQLAEAAARPKDHEHDDSADTTGSIVDDGACEPKLECAGSSSQAADSSSLPVDMSGGPAQPAPAHAQPVLVSAATQMPARHTPVKTPAAKKSLQNISLPPLQANSAPYMGNGYQMPPPGAILYPPPGALPSPSLGAPSYQSAPPLAAPPQSAAPPGEGMSQLSAALHALASANVGIADALRALCTRVTNK